MSVILVGLSLLVSEGLKVQILQDMKPESTLLRTHHCLQDWGKLSHFIIESKFHSFA